MCCLAIVPAIIIIDLTLSFSLYEYSVFLGLKINSLPSRTRVPDPPGNQATQQEVSGGRASEASLAAPHHSPLLALPPEPSPSHLVHGKIVFHETGPWCQKGWGPLL